MTSDSLSFDNIIAIVPSSSQINHSDKWMKMDENGEKGTSQRPNKNLF